MTTRASLAHRFRDGASAPWKTFVLEVHAADEPEALLVDVFGARQVAATEDAYLHEVHDVNNGASFVVDHLEERFWSFHTHDPIDATAPLLKDAVETRRDLDWMWLPSLHLRNAWLNALPAYLKSDFRGRRLLPDGEAVQDLEVQLTGSAADRILSLIADEYGTAISFDRILFDLTDPDLGDLREGITRQGRFVARGNSFEFHQHLVRGVISRYRRFVDLLERQAMTWTELPDGGVRFAGSPIGIRFSRLIPDRVLFIDQLFSCREPFRLWGVPADSGSVAEVEAVDLHVGQRLPIDIGPDWIRVYLLAGNCGNTVARLIANLQHHFDAALTLSDPELQMALATPEGQGPDET